MMAASAGAATFSHRVHLAQKLPCLTCHAAATTSVLPADNLLPGPETCAGCHTGAPARPAKVEAVIKTPAPTLVSKFNHRQHLRIGTWIPRLIAKAIDTKTYLSPSGGIREQLVFSNACTGCHRGLAQSDQVTKVNLPQMADCLVCHTKIEPPFSCATCHVDSPALKPANHGPGFVDLHSSGKANHDKTTRAVCHGRRFTCLGCH
jgi:hypothetical protein